MEGSLRGVNILIHAEGFQSGGTQPASGCFIQNIKGSRRVEKLLPCCQHLLEHTIQLRTHERGQTGRRDHWKIQDRIDWAPDHPGRTEFRRCGQDVVENSQQLMVVFDFDISALRRRSETWLLLKHLRKIHQDDRVILDHLLKFPDYRMKRSCLFLSDFSGVRKPSVQNLPVRREPMSETAGLFVVCRVVHVSLEQCTSTCRRRCSDCEFRACGHPDIGRKRRCGKRPPRSGECDDTAIKAATTGFWGTRYSLISGASRAGEHSDRVGTRPPLHLNAREER